MASTRDFVLQYSGAEVNRALEKADTSLQPSDIVDGTGSATDKVMNQNSVTQEFQNLVLGTTVVGKATLSTNADNAVKMSDNTYTPLLKNQATKLLTNGTETIPQILQVGGGLLVENSSPVQIVTTSVAEGEIYKIRVVLTNSAVGTSSMEFSYLVESGTTSCAIFPILCPSSSVFGGSYTSHLLYVAPAGNFGFGSVGLYAKLVMGTGTTNYTANLYVYKEFV